MSRLAGARAVDLLHELVAIPSITGAESALIDFLKERFRRRVPVVETIEVSPGRHNLFVRNGVPRVVLTTHADTVAPQLEPRREGSVLFARGACDAKGSLAAMALAFEELSGETSEVGLLVLIGEELGSDGALAANQNPPQGVQFLVGGEPTGNRYVAGCKGCVRVQVEVSGKAGHSSLSDSDSSAVAALLDFLDALRRLDMPPHPRYGTTTMNIGVLRAGTAPNVIAQDARAEIVFRTGAPVEDLLEKVRQAACASPDLLVGVPYRSEAVSFRVPRGSDADVVAFACDLPLLGAWGEPLLIGPGSIRDAHAMEEKVDLQEIEQAVAIYCDLARGLLRDGERFLKSGELAD